MAWLAISMSGEERIFSTKPYKDCFCIGEWNLNGISIILPKGSIAKLIGRKLTWSDEPYELK